MVHFPHILIPVATEEGARATYSALEPYLGDTERVTAVHVIEKAGGTPDEAPLEKRPEDASDFPAIVDPTRSRSVTTETKTVFATDVGPALFSEASDAGADAGADATEAAAVSRESSPVTSRRGSSLTSPFPSSPFRSPSERTPRVRRS